MIQIGYGKMTNPCKKCLVEMMCKYPCNEFVDYLKLNLLYSRPGYDFYEFMAKKVRGGEVILINRDREAVWVKPTHYTPWWKGNYVKPM